MNTQTLPVMAFFSFNYQSGILLFLFLWGCFYAILLFTLGRKEKNQAAQWLSVFVGLCSLNLVPWMLGHSNWYARDGYREVLFFVPFQQLLFLGPVLYIYIRKLLQPPVRLSPKIYRHMLPGLLYLLYSLLIFMVDVVILDASYFYADGIDKDLKLWYQLLGLLSLILYLALSLHYYHRYRKNIVQEVSYADALTFGWVRRFLWALLFIVLLRSIFLVLFPQFGNFGTKWWYYVLFGILAAYIAFTGYLHLVRISVPAYPMVQPPEVPFNQESPSSATQKIVAHLAPLKKELRRAVEEQQLYLDPTLNINQVAQQVKANSKAVSTIINQGFGVNFNDWINGFRVEAVIQRCQQGDHHQFTLLSIALECGFNSKATFNRAFKKKTGQTPRHFLTRLDQSPPKGIKS